MIWKCLKCGDEKFYVYTNRPVGFGRVVVKCCGCGWKWFGILIEKEVGVGDEE